MLESLPPAAVCWVTCESREQADKIAQELLQKRLVACVNIVPGLTSMYWWQGKIETATEVMLMIKTRQERVRDVIAAVKALHSYSVPEVISVPIEQGNPDYLRWIAAETEIKNA